MIYAIEKTKKKLIEYWSCPSPGREPIAIYSYKNNSLARIAPCQAIFLTT